MNKNERKIICVGEPMKFKDLEKYERDSIFEHWVGLAKEFHKNKQATNNSTENKNTA